MEQATARFLSPRTISPLVPMSMSSVSASRAVKPGGHQAAHGVAAYEARDVGQNPHIPGGGQKGLCAHYPLCALFGHIGRSDQGPGVNAQQQMVHGRVAHNGGAGDFLRRNGGFLGRLPGQTVQGGEDAVLHLFPAAVQHILNPGDHIRAVLALGVQGAGLGEQGSGFPGQQIGNHGGGADIDGKRVFVGPHRSRLDALTLGQNSGGGGLGKGHGAVRPHNSLTGQDFCPGLYCDFAFPAGPVARRRVRRASGLPEFLPEAAWSPLPPGR